MKRFMKKHGNTELPILGKFKEWRKTLSDLNVQPTGINAKTQRLHGGKEDGADLFIVIMGTNTCGKGKNEIPPWNTFRHDHLALIETIARSILNPEGVVVIVHGAAMAQSKLVYDAFRAPDMLEWRPPETFTVWNDTPRYKQKGAKQVSEVVFYFPHSRLFTPRLSFLRLFFFWFILG